MTRFDGMAFETPDIREIEHAALQCKQRSISPDEPDTVVNGFIDHLPSVSPADTSFACFIAGEGDGG